MADIELVIRISEEVKQAFDCAESNEIKGGYYDHSGVIGKAIKNGTPLPKGHGDLVDIDTIYIDEVDFYDGADYERAINAVNNAPTIIEADKE